MAAETIRIELPTDARYLDVAVAAVEALAVRAGLDKDDVGDLRDQLHDALAARLTNGHAGRVVLRYEVGEGFLGLRVEDAGSTS